VNRFALLVFRPRGAGQITTDDRLEGDDLGLLHQHCPTVDLIRMFPDLLRHLVNARSDEMGRSNVLQLVEPEDGNLCQDSTLSRNAIFHDNIVGGDPIRSNEQQTVGI